MLLPALHSSILVWHYGKNVTRLLLHIQSVYSALMAGRLQKVSEFFEFSRGQLTALAILALASLVSGTYLVVRTYTTPVREVAPFPVFLGDSDSRLMGYFVVDPNTSPADSLELLPGIGKVLADRIVEFRRKKKFIHEVDITEVRGIGPKLFERLRPYLRIVRQ